MTIIKIQEGVFVADVTIRHEVGGILHAAIDEKVVKYGSLLPQLREKFRSQKREVLAIVVGTRGAMPDFTPKALRRLGVAAGVMKTISLIAL